MNAQLALPESADALTQEDQARANLYALISRLFYAGPDTELLAAIARADEIVDETADKTLAQAWVSLVSAAGAIDAEAAQTEYDSVFIGTGKAEVTLYASHYLAESMKENVLVRLRADVAAMGLQRDPVAVEYEDHFSGMCDVMRHLIFFATDVAVQKQKTFFMGYLSNCYPRFCAAVIASANTNFYKHAARFAKAFLDVEAESFEIGR